MSNSNTTTTWTKLRNFVKKQNLLSWIFYVPLITAILFSVSFLTIRLERDFFLKEKAAINSVQLKDIERTLDLKDTISLKIVLRQSIDIIKEYEKVEDSFSALQTATSILEIAIGVGGVAFPVFILVFYFILGRDFTQIREIEKDIWEKKGEIQTMKSEIDEDHKYIKDKVKEIDERKDHMHKELSFLFERYNPLHLETDIAGFYEGISINKKEEEKTDNDYFIEGGIKYAEGKYDVAIQKFELAISKSSSQDKRGLYYFYIGLSYDDLFSSTLVKEDGQTTNTIRQNADKAIEYYTLAFENRQAPKNKSLALSNLAFTHLEIGKQEKDIDKLTSALTDFKRAQGLNENDPYISFGIAITEFKLSEITESKAEKIEASWIAYKEGEKLVYTDKGRDYYKVYSKLQFEFMKREIYELFIEPTKVTNPLESQMGDIDA